MSRRQSRTSQTPRPIAPSPSPAPSTTSSNHVKSYQQLYSQTPGPIPLLHQNATASSSSTSDHTQLHHQSDSQTPGHITSEQLNPTLPQNELDSPMRPPATPASQSISSQSQQATDPYAWFCHQITKVFRNLAIGIAGAIPGVEELSSDSDLNSTESTPMAIPMTAEHYRIAQQTSLAIIALQNDLPLPPKPPYDQQNSQEEIELNDQTLWIISYPHSHTPHGEMRSGMADYFRNTERQLKRMCDNREWGFLARRCRRRFAKFIEELPGFEYETEFNYIEGSWE